MKAKHAVCLANASASTGCLVELHTRSSPPVPHWVLFPKFLFVPFRSLVAFAFTRPNPRWRQGAYGLTLTVSQFTVLYVQITVRTASSRRMRRGALRPGSIPSQTLLENSQEQTVFLSRLPRVSLSRSAECYGRRFRTLRSCTWSCLHGPKHR